MTLFMLIHNEIRKIRSRPFYLLSSIYIIYVTISSAFGITLNRVLSSSDLLQIENIEIQIFNVATRWGLIIFCILIIVTWSTENKYKIFPKTIISGYSRSDLFYSLLLRNFFYSIIYTFFFACILVFYSFNIVDGLHAGSIHPYLLLVFSIYFFGSIISSFLVLYTGKTYLSIIILIFLVISNQLFLISDRFIGVDISFFHPLSLQTAFTNAFNVSKIFLSAVSVTVYMLLTSILLLFYFQKRRFI